MASIDVIKEYLVSMGLQDNFTDNFNKVLDESENKMGRFANTFAGKFALAGVAVVSVTAMANVAIGKFLGNMAKSDLAMEMYAKSIGKTKQEATRLDTTLKAMGRTIEEINSNAELKMNFKKLQKDTEKVQPPDMSEGMKQIREIQFEFVRLKQNATYALNWVGYYLTKYLKDPIEKIQEGFKGLNDIVIKNMPKWTDNIAKVLSWVVRLGTTLIRGATTVYTAIKRIFDMIPRELKIVGAAIIGLGLLIRAGPIGKLVMIITGLLLLLDDFYTYINGGDALLGGFWQKLIDIYETLKNSGAIDKFKEAMTNAFEFASKVIVRLKDYVIELFNKFKESGSIEKFLILISRLIELIKVIGEPLKNVGQDILLAFGGMGKVALEWFIEKGLPKMIDLVSGVIGIVADVISKLNEFGATEVIIKGVLGAFLAFKTVGTIKGVIGGITKSAELATKGLESMAKKMDIAKASIGKLGEPGALKSLGLEIKGTSKAFVGLIKSAKELAVAKAKDIAGTVQLIAMYGKEAIAKGASTAATWAQTAATSAWNVAAGIGATVTKAFGAAIAFLTSPIGLVILAIGALIAITVLVIKNWDKVKEFFIGLWDKIKNIFSGVGNWFKEKFDKAKESVISTFSNIGNWFKNRHEDIKNAFSGVGGWFKKKFTEAREGATTAFSTAGDYFSRVYDNIQLIFSGVKALFSGNFQGAYDAVVAIWNNITGFWKKIFGLLPQPVQDAILKIKEIFAPIVAWFADKILAITKAFSNIPSSLRDTFISAVNNIKKVFSPLVDWFKEKIDKIKGFFGGIGDKVKGIFGKGDPDPDEDDPNPNPNPKPIGHAEGGVFFNKHEAEIAEDGPEAVIPLTKPNRAKEILSQIKNFIGPDRDRPGGVVNLDGIKQSLSQIVNVLSGVKNGLNEQQNVNYTSNGGNVTINNITVSPQSHNKIYGSGNPEATANAINRNTINSIGLLLRNTQGVIG